MISQITGTFLQALGIVGLYQSSGSVPVGGQITQHIGLTNCQESVLDRIFVNAIVLKNTDQYSHLQSDYFSAIQSALQPECFFIPNNADEISKAIMLLRTLKCPFALKGGGHATFGGSSNIDRGITIDMRNLESVSLSPERDIVSIGAGNRWLDVYKVLEKENITVVGGRTGSVGVGGLLLGGGLSFFSGLKGLSCDNVQNYEAVLSNGSIINVNLTSSPDLYWALRGGGNNFAIITRFDLYAFHHEYMWGGILDFAFEEAHRLIDATVNFGLHAHYDPSSFLITTLLFSDGSLSVTADLYCTEPHPNPPTFHEILDIPHSSSTTKIQRQSEIAATNYRNQPDGSRQSYWTLTFRLDRQLAHHVQQIFAHEFGKLHNPSDVQARCIIQIMTLDILHHMQKNGGNPLGLSSKDGPLMLLNLALRWGDSNDDVQMLQASNNFIARVSAIARRTGVHVAFLHMNYASHFQDVINSYGPANAQRLRDIAQQYDGTGMFQDLQPGYFKLNGRVGY